MRPYVARCPCCGHDGVAADEESLCGRCFNYLDEDDELALEGVFENMMKEAEEL